MFTPSEDSQLCYLVSCYGPKNWNEIAKQIPGKSGRQCRDRYKNYLSPDVIIDHWTSEEEALLAEKYAEYGPQWARIAMFFHGRTGAALKNRWRYHVSHRVNKKSKSSSSRESDTNTSKEQACPVDLVFQGLEEKLAQTQFDALESTNDLSILFT